MKVLKADEGGLLEAAATIRVGGVVVYPTETVYGIGCLPIDPDATRKVCEIKGRADKPLPLICSDVGIARRVVEFNPAAERMAEEFWPGPLMLVLPKKMDYPIWVTHGAKTLGIRVPSHEAARRLTKLSGGVIVSTSANRSGEPPIRSAEEAERQLGQEVDVILDGGPMEGSEPSTVLDISSTEAWILRKGPITAEQIMKVLRG